MAPKKSSLIRDYFKFDEETNKSICQLLVESVELKCQDENDEELRIIEETICSFPLSGNQASNMEKHVKTKHPKKFQEYMTRKRKHPASRKRKNCKRLRLEKKSSHVLPREVTLKKYRKQKSSNMKPVLINYETVIDGIVEMICVHGQPYSFVEDAGFMKIVRPIFDAFDLAMNRNIAAEYVHRQFLNLRAEVELMLSGRMVSLKVDCVSHMMRSFVGINVQFLYHGKIAMLNLSTVEVPAKHSGENFMQMILAEAEKWKIDASHVYCMVVDNGSNIVNAARLMGHKSKGEEAGELDDRIDVVYEFDNDDILRMIELEDTLLKCPRRDSFIIGMRCVVHVLQSSINDTLQNKAKIPGMSCYQDAIEIARSVVEQLRNEEVLRLIEAQNLRIPVLDCETRWNSTYDMLYALYNDHRQICEQYKDVFPELKVEEETWVTIEEIILTLKPCSLATMKLQRPDLCLTDVYKIMNVCLMQTGAIGGAMSSILCDNLNQRRSQCFSSDTFLACQFLDPRFHFELTAPKDRDRAIQHIIRIYKRIMSLKDKDTNRIDEAVHEEASAVSFNNTCDEDDAFEREYEKTLQRKHEEVKRVSSITASEFEVICHSYCPELLSTMSKETVHEWWFKKRDTYKELYLVAEVLFGVPASQILVEQLLSQVNFMLNRHQINSARENINETLWLKTNLPIINKLKSVQ